MEGIQKELLKIQSLGLLERLLSDKTTKTNILWATDAYKERGIRYERDQEITAELITGTNAGIIKTRARKALEHQSERTKSHAEVFTPLWICQKMNDHADEVWFKRKDVFFKDGVPIETILFPKHKTWKHYVDARRLEITCGEAPYLVSRYDVSTGESIPIESRVGILDRKLRIVNENAADEAEWIEWAIRAFQATYGYEFQGDNLLIARLNLFMTFEEYLEDRWKRKPTKKEYSTIANIVAWNIWQMDGLAGTIPYCKAEEENHQFSLFEMYGLVDEEEKKDTQPVCRIYDWRKDNSREFIHINEGEIGNMKFDFIIGNPPYQDETIGENKGYAPPIYHMFLENAYQLSDRVELIHPARFLFNAGSTPKAWNQKMLHDEHFQILHYYAESKDVFPNTLITGGIAISYHDADKSFGSIEIFTPFPELNSILKKVQEVPSLGGLHTIAVSRTAYRLTEKLHHDYPDAINLLSKGHAFDMSTNIFERLPHVFFDEKPTDGHNYIQVLGREGNNRIYKFIRSDYVNEPANLHNYKIFMGRANGASGALGAEAARLITAPFVGNPEVGNTESFLSIGNFKSRDEAIALEKYIKGKFARALLGVLKTTQDITPEKWQYVPLQDFTAGSDIDWSKPVPDIDCQLYTKYGLDEDEIAFIDSHVKELE